MSVDVLETVAAFVAGVPRLLFKGSRLNLTNGYDVRADGQQFLIPGPDDIGDQGAPITVVLNWWVELE